MVEFEPITTERLRIRHVTADDAGALWERRNEPDVARFQSWTLPFPSERAQAVCEAVAETSGPANDEWWMATVTSRDDDREGRVVGDIALKLGFDGRSAEIGYTFATAWWGRGLATEAVRAMIDWLVDDVGVERVGATTHPDNLASVVVLERLGLRFEGHTRGSYWVGDEVSDDWLFGMTAADYRAWRNRPLERPDSIGLVELTPDNVHDVAKLETHASQRRFVSPMLHSLADIVSPPLEDGEPVVPWPRAIEADGAIVGFVMLTEITEHHPEPYLWRFLIDRMHQRRGIGGLVLDLVIEQAQAWGATGLGIGWVDEIGGPGPFYLSRGFAPTGRIVDGEVEARLALPQP